MKIIEATKEHITEISILFDLYRQFYEFEPDIELATTYISERIENGDSAIFIAIDDGAIIGFVQMYPSLCSVHAIKIYILYDLYVNSKIRNAGVGALLMNKASEYAKNQGASRLDLITGFSNKVGQHLYEKLGYQKVLKDYHTYSLQV